jgi:hypothetical protein
LIEDNAESGRKILTMCKGATAAAENDDDNDNDNDNHDDNDDDDETKILKVYLPQGPLLRTTMTN